MSLQPPESSNHPSKWSAKDPWKEVKLTPGAYPSSPQPDSELDLLGQRSLASAVRERRQDYIRKRNLKIKVGTWNVASIRSTHKDLAAWFINGLGVKGLHQNLSGLSVLDDSDYSSDEQVESVAHQESRSNRKQSTVPVGEAAAVPSDEDVGLYVLGLQEIVDITSITEAMRPYYDPNPAKKWKSAVKRGLPPGYVKIAEQQLLGLLILVFAAPDVAPQVTSVACHSIGTGAFGYVGNKGAVSVRVVLGGTTRLLFVNCHLAAGADQAALSRRIWDTNQILSRTKFDAATLDGEEVSGGQESIGDEDFAFWFGDLNYRLDDIPGEDVRRLLLLHTRNEYDVLNKSRMRIDSELGYIDAHSSDTLTVPKSEERRASSSTGSAKESSAEPALDPKEDPASLITTIRSLFQHDQLRAQQRLGKAFHEGWREGEINFLPTYKYDIGSVGMFDSGEKKRSPSWCDRILYRTRQDRLDYEERVKQGAEARKRDQEMKAKGLDTDAAEQEILFDYDPDTDGADNDDDYDENEDAQDTQSVVTQTGLEDVVTLEQYISHQRVLSSDHKPLSAVFNLTFDAVVPELKAQVQHEVARMLDKNENETRPNVTVVVDNPIEGAANADRPAGATELNAVELDEVRYHVPKTRALTIANTGPIPATFAFIDRPVGEGQEKGPFPPWMNIQVHHESQPTPKEKDDLGLAIRFVLSPGEVAAVDITVDIKNEDFVYALNEGETQVDDILVLRVLHGRDHFVSVKGAWCPTSFYRYLDELVRYPKGVRSGLQGHGTVTPRRGSTAYHSAPQELFELTETLPGLVERAIADWTMTNFDATPPWEADASWPFMGHVWKADDEYRSTQLAGLREALDTATPVADQLDEQLPPLARAELLAEVLVSFLQSLKDGIIPNAAWQVIEENIVNAEKAKSSMDYYTTQEVVMEALSNAPIHSVSLTFVTFMLARVIAELSSIGVETMQSPVSLASRRTRSSTENSEAPSESSITSTESASTISSFLPSLSRRKTGTASSVSTVKSVQAPPDRRSKHREAYAELWSKIIIRSERDALVKGKDKKLLDARRKKVIELLIDSPAT